MSRSSHRRTGWIVAVVAAVVLVCMAVRVGLRPAFPASIWVSEQSAYPRGPRPSEPFGRFFKFASLFSPMVCAQPGGEPLPDARTSAWFGDAGNLVAVEPDTALDARLNSVSAWAHRALRPSTVYVLTDRCATVGGVLWMRCDAIDDERRGKLDSGPK